MGKEQRLHNTCIVNLISHNVLTDTLYSNFILQDWENNNNQMSDQITGFHFIYNYHHHLSGSSLFKTFFTFLAWMRCVWDTHALVILRCYLHFCKVKLLISYYLKLLTTFTNRCHSVLLEGYSIVGEKLGLTFLELLFYVRFRTQPWVTCILFSRSFYCT